jgi:hypothetical protein
MKNDFHLMMRALAAIVGAISTTDAKLFAQTNFETTNGPLKLLPPYGELPPTFWEQHASPFMLACLGIIMLASLGLWLIFRPRPTIIIPPEVQARAALENLRRQPEDGVVLSRVSQIVRHYFSAAFQLSPGELTTTEFYCEVSGKENIGAELSTAAAGFLAECDANKFSSNTGTVKLDAANRALNLIAQAEQRRAQLRQLTESQLLG